MNETTGPVLLKVQEAADRLRFTNRRAYSLLRDERVEAFQYLPNGEWRLLCDPSRLPGFGWGGG